MRGSTIEGASRLNSASILRVHIATTYGFNGTIDFLYSSSSEYIQPINIGITPSRKDTYKNFNTKLNPADWGQYPLNSKMIQS